MKNIISHSFDYQKDKERLLAFWLAYRATSDVRLYPTIWRLLLLLTSRVWQQEKDTQIWQDTSGQIIGFGMLWRRYQTSRYTIFEGYVHPEFVTQEIVAAMLQWGDSRAKEIAKEQESDFTVFLSGLSQYDFSVRLLEQDGYTYTPADPNEYDVYFAKSLQNENLTPEIPAGYTIRKLKDAHDLETYQAINGFAKVNPRHQEEQIESAEYAHFVVTDSDGTFVAYCECSIWYAEWEKTHQRIGWIDYVETSSDQQKKGLGRAAILAGLSQLQRWGAETVMLITISSNTPAINLYKKTGFNPVEIQEYPIYQKQILSSPPADLLQDKGRTECEQGSICYPFAF